MPPELDELGLRERKKDETRRRLRESAARLFAERGFAGTTVLDIAADANVSERTFFRYFTSKEALLLPDAVHLFDYIAAAVVERPLDENPFEAVSNALLEAKDPFVRSSLTALAHPVPGTETLIRNRLMAEFASFEYRLVDLVRGRLPEGMPDADLVAAVVAGAVLAAARAVLYTQRSRRAAGAPVDPSQLLPKAFDILTRIGTPSP
jgi:AcrR family transcriptional regulator